MKSGSFRSINWLFILWLAVFGFVAHVHADSATTVTTGSMNVARRLHRATLLGNGQVLVTGGIGYGGARASSELYNPATGTWLLTGSMSVGRYGHTATMLQNGKVLVVGGGPDVLTTLASAEIYDPLTGTWATTGSMSQPRYNHTATLLPDGKVLVAGGMTELGYLSSAEIYDPTLGTWTPTGSMSQLRYNHTAVLLPNGKVLVAGGGFGNTPTTITELYDPNTGSWINTGSLTFARFRPSVTLLNNGEVLLAGGSNEVAPVSLAELYNPSTGLWTVTGSMQESAGGRAGHTATLMPNGQVLVTGGNTGNGNGVLITTELYDPGTGTWASSSSMTENRTAHTATLLPSGQVLLVGGYNPYSTIDALLASAELYTLPQQLDQTVQVNIHAPFSAQSGEQFTVSATASSGLPVQYGSTGACTNVDATFTMISGTGTCTVLYDQPGDATYKLAPQIVEVVEDANDPPMALTLSSTSVAENLPAGTVVGTFGSVDLDAGDTFTYSLVDGVGYEDNASFNIPGDQLQTASVFDATVKNSYNIRVRTTDNGVGNLSLDQTFTITVTDNNDTPSLLAPANASQLLNNRPTFDWTDVPGAVSYRIQIYASSNFGRASKIVNTTTSLSTYSPSSDLPANSTLYWRVQVMTGTGTGPWSDIWMFTTANPPSTPTLISPKNNAKGITIYPLLDWTDSTLPAGTYFQEYELQLSTNPDFSAPIEVHSTGVVGSSAVLLNIKGVVLQIGTKYYWRVRTFNTLSQYSSWSTVFKFTTIK